MNLTYLDTLRSAAVSRVLIALLCGPLLLDAATQDCFWPRLCQAAGAVEPDADDAAPEEEESSPSPSRRCESRSAAPLPFSCGLSARLPRAAAPRPGDVNPLRTSPGPVPLRC